MELEHSLNISVSVSVQGSSSRAARLPWADKKFQNGSRAGKISVCLPYMAGKISSFNFRGIKTQGKSISNNLETFSFCSKEENYRFPGPILVTLILSNHGEGTIIILTKFLIFCKIFNSKVMAI